MVAGPYRLGVVTRDEVGLTQVPCDGESLGKLVEAESGGRGLNL